MAVQAVAAVVKTMNGDVTAETLTKALNETKSVTLPGDYVWTPGVAGPKLWPRVSTFSFYYMTVRDGKLEVDSGPHDLSSFVPDSLPTS